MSHHAAQIISFALAIIPLATAGSGLMNSAVGQECTHECDDCPTSAYYNAGIGDEPCRRNDVELRYFLMGPVYCSVAKNIIHENGTCADLERVARGAREDRYGYLFYSFDIRVEWNETDGCKVFGKAPRWSTQTDFHTNICLQAADYLAWLGTILLGIVAGFALAFISIRCTRNTVSDEHFAEHEGRKEDFWPGAKLKAADHIVKGGGTRRMTLLFRISQTIANAWLPMTVLIFMSPATVGTLYVLLYVIPAFLTAGFALFLQPVYLITPPDMSLFGIDHIQPDFSRSYLFHAIRPVLFVGGTFLATYVLAKMLPEKDEGFWTYNLSGFFRAGMMEGSGPLVLDFVLAGTIVGTVTYSSMVIALVLQKWIHDIPIDPITFVKHEQRADEIQDLAHKICDVAIALENEGSDNEEEKTRSLEELGVEPESIWSVRMAMGLAVVDLAAYAYKVWVFLRGGRYFLAVVIVSALSESFFVLHFNGSLARARDAFRRTARDGIPTYDYLALCQWDDGLAGVPYLMTTIYGLPLAGIHTWLATFSGILFICTGTRAMGNFIMDAVDSDMFDVAPPKDLEEDEERHDFLHYLQAVESEAEE